MLLKKERNHIFNLVVKHGFSSDDFLESNNAEFYNLKRFDEPFYIKLKTNGNYHAISTLPVVGLASPDYRKWETCASIIDDWLGIVKQEDDTPDLWVEAQANAKLFAIDPAIPDEMFNAAELRQLEGQVRQLVQGLIVLHLPPHAEKALTDTVKEIPEKATRFTKKELEGWFMGAFIAQVTNLALSPEHVTAVAHLIKSTFFGLLGLN